MKNMPHIAHDRMASSLDVIKVGKGKFKMSNSTGSHVEACRPFGDNGLVKMCLSEAIP
jgi:hypothetical protein